MPIGGEDKQYNLSWNEQDKVRRRQEIKQRLKLEGIKKRYDPYKVMKDDVIEDPALNRYMDIRKKGRMPGAPFRPTLFFGMVGVALLPIWFIKLALEWDRGDLMDKIASGDFPVEKRKFKSVA